MQARTERGWAVAAALAAAAACLAPGRGSAEAPAPLPWIEPAPTARLFLQLPLEAPALLAPGERAFALRLLYSNSLVQGSTAALALDVHVETAQPVLHARLGLADGLEVQFSGSVIADDRGVLDGGIYRVESMVGLVNPARRLPLSARFVLERPGGAGVAREGGGVGIGDLWVGLKARLLEGGGPWPAAALRAAVKLPLATMPYGSEEVDLGASATAGWAWGHTGLVLQLDGIWPTGALGQVGLATRFHWTASAALSHALGRVVALHAQASHHGAPLSGSGLAQLDAPTSYVLAGATFRVRDDLAVQLGVAENVFSPARGADISFLLAVGSPR